MKTLATIETENGSIFIRENSKDGRVYTKSVIDKYNNLETDKANYFPEVTNLLGDVINSLELSGVDFDYIIHVGELSEATEEIY